MTTQSKLKYTIICAKWIAPIEPDCSTVLVDNAVVIRNDDGTIVEILTQDQARAKYIVTSETESNSVASSSSRNDQQEDGNGSMVYGTSEEIKYRELGSHLLIPGLVNAHTHTGLSIMRGKADDEYLFDWLEKTLWPIEARFVHEPRFCYDGALLAISEMVAAGVTTFNDMYWSPEQLIEAVTEANVRALVGLICIGFPSGYAGTQDEYIEHGMKVYREFGGKNQSKDGLYRFCWAPHAPYTVPDDFMKRIFDLSTEMSLPMHIHLHETQDECRASESLDRTSMACHKSDHAMRPLANLERMGVLNEKTIAVHMCHLTDEEIRTVSNRKMNVVHCPTSNMKLASGWCQVNQLTKAGVNVAIGTDSAASNNNLDMFQEMKLTAIMSKNVSSDATAIPAHVALKMATLNGAKALGMDDIIGSIVAGKKADLVAIELGNRPGTSPIYSPISTLVYSAVASDVQYVWVNGTCIYDDRKFTTINLQYILERSRKWGNDIHHFIDKKV